MIDCPVCATKNSDLNVVCTECGGYLQPRVQTLDLFTTLWMLIESPKNAFKRISLSEQKNYIHFLAAVTGIGIVFTWLWRVRGGWIFDNNLQVLILGGLLSGPIVGILVLYAGSLVFDLAAHLTGAKGKYRDAKAVLAYAMVPLVLATVFIVPLELGFFGISFFTMNPSPMVLKPVIYIALLGLTGLSILWSFILLVIGTRVLFSRNRVLSVLLSALTLASIGSVFYGVPW